MRLAVLLLCSMTAGVNAAERESFDVIVVGAGIAGLAAALEAADRGASVCVLELNSVGGGHAVIAGGLALVGTPLQAKQGIVDTPALAIADWSRWAETADPAWLERYAVESGPRVYDWLTRLGVEFVMLLPSPENSVRRFHFTRGTSINVVLPMLRRAYEDPRIRVVHNVEVTKLIRRGGRVTGVQARDVRTSRERSLYAGAIIVATGGFESDLTAVRDHWLARTPMPERLLSGAARSATGRGQRLAADAGATLTHLDRHTIFANGLPDPRDQSGERALAANHPDAVWVNAQGARFVDESADPKTVHAALMKQRPMHYWLVFDSRTRGRLRVRDAVWLDAETIADEILANANLTSRADDLRQLARHAGIDELALAATIRRHNDGGAKATIEVPPFYAVRLYPMTRKSMGGIAVDDGARALDRRGKPVRGLYAAGEVTGVAGINGEHGMSGTFLGPSVLMGRIAGETAVADMGELRGYATTGVLPDIEGEAASAARPASGALPASAAQPAIAGGSVGAVRALASVPSFDANRPGYWHFARSHGMVSERKLDCGTCHSAEFPQQAPAGPQRVKQLDTCLHCH